MRVNMHNSARRFVASVDVDAAHPPRVVPLPRPRGEQREQLLDWDRAFDDEGHLRKCPVCSCEELYRRALIPPLTGFLVVLVVGLITLLLWGLYTAPLWLVWAALGGVAAANVLIYLLGPELLVCYRCASQFQGVKISEGHNGWDTLTDAKYRPAPASPAASPVPAPTAPPEEGSEVESVRGG